MIESQAVMPKTEIPLRIAGRALVVNQNNELLLVSSSPLPFWYTPGGRLEGKESIEQAARRETYEETGIRLARLKLVYIRDVLDFTKKEKPVHHLAFYYFARTTQELPENWEDHDHHVDKVKFFSQHELAAEESVLPPFLKDQFWQDLEQNFQHNHILFSSHTIGV